MNTQDSSADLGGLFAQILFYTFVIALIIMILKVMEPNI